LKEIKMRLTFPVRIFAVVTLFAATPALPAPIPLDYFGHARGPEVDADTPQAREYRAGIQSLIQGDIPAAKTHYEAALMLVPDYAPALIGLADIAQRQNNTLQIEQYLRSAERAAPRSPAVHLAWGRYYMRSKQLRKAESALMKAHEIEPRAIPPILELGDLYLLSGRARDSLAMFRKAVALDEKNKFAQYGFGSAAAISGLRDEALHAFAEAAALAPEDAAPLRATGLIYLESGDAGKALAAFDAGLVRQPTFTPLMVGRADALSHLKRWDDALTQIAQVEKLAPKAAEIKLKRADIYQAAARWDEAEEQYLNTVKLDPTMAMAYNNLAWMTIARMGDAAKAIAWARQAVTLSPGSSPFRDTLGWAYRSAGDLPNAQASLLQAIQLEPNVADYYFHLGVIQAEMKQPGPARASLQRALDLNPHLPDANEARRVLTTLPAI